MLILIAIQYIMELNYINNIWSTNHMTDDLIDIGLPKWPQMLVTGQPVTVDQAKDIIFRTDFFFTDECKYSGGNCKEFNDAYREAALLNKLRDSCGDKWSVLSPVLQKLRAHLQCVDDLEYIHNSFGSSAFVFGAHGWCRPDGTISFNYNVGKWPSVESIYDEWCRVATTFPYLDLHVTLMSDEWCEDVSTPLVNIRVLDGAAVLQNPDSSVHTVKPVPSLEAFLQYESNREIGCPTQWYKDYAAKVASAITELKLL
jgi:hypothetical protein